MWHSEVAVIASRSEGGASRRLITKLEGEPGWIFQLTLEEQVGSNQRLLRPAPAADRGGDIGPGEKHRKYVKST